MVSANYKIYQRIIHWPDLKMVREKGGQHPWHVEEPSISCLAGSRITVISGQRSKFKIWIAPSLDRDKLCMLDPGGNEVSPDEICNECAGRVMRLLKWWSSDEGSLEIEQQASRDDLEERESRAKGIIE